QPTHNNNKPKPILMKTIFTTKNQNLMKTDPAPVAETDFSSSALARNLNILSQTQKMKHKTNNMKNLNFLYSVQTSLNETTRTSRCNSTAKTVQTRKNSTRLKTAWLMMSIILLMFLPGMAWGQIASATWSLNSNGNSSTSGNVSA